MYSHFTFLALLAGTALASETDATIAKTYPTSSRYPQAQAWDALDAVTGGRVYKCPLTGKIADACGAPSLQSDYVLVATSPSEVAEGLKFATKHNLRVTVRNTGHDFMARHSGLGAFTIVTSSMKATRFTRAWTPTVGSDEFKAKQLARQQTAVQIDAGATFYDVLQALQPKGHATVHGADGTVGAAGGWILGGGHGPWSNQYGLGCDNILELEVALTNGTIVTANEESYPDLFWASRGGGGSTFGVVTRATMKTFPIPIMYPVALHISWGTTGREGFLDAIAHLFAMTPNFTDFGISGYPVISNTTYLASLTAPGKSASELTDFISPVVNRLQAYGAYAHFMIGPAEWGYWSPTLGLAIGNLRIPDVLGDIHKEQNKWREIVKRDSRLDRRQVVDMKVMNQLPIASMGSRLLARSKLNEGNFPAIRKMLGEVKGYLLPYPNAGGVVTKNRGLDIGLNPAWRDTAMHLIAVNYDRPHNVRAMAPLSVNNSAYINEGFEFEEDWQTTFFGPKEHYARLLAVKKKYDPTNTLWCFPCVGGDVFVEKQGKLYMAAAKME